MSDTFTETTHKSWFSRIKSAFGGILFGIILVIAAIAGLFWNEGRAVKTATALTEGAGQVVTVDPSNVGAELNGKLVHFTGALQPDGTVKDTLMPGISAPDGSVQLVRKVEMYQWDQDTKKTKQKKLGGGEETVTTYSYKKVWSERAINSSSFKKPQGHENPNMPFKSEKFGVESGTVGALKINGSKFSYLGKKSPMVLNESQLTEVRKQFDYNRDIVSDGSNINVSMLSGTQTVGDLRISFESGAVETLSGVGKLQDGAIVSFEASNGREISLFSAGEVPADKMFENAQSANTFMTWGLRLAGFIAMLIGFNMIFSVIGVLGDVVPMIGDMFRFATGLLALALTAIISTLVIGIAWIYFRPVVGISIIAAGLILAVGSLVIGKAKARKKAQEAQVGLA